MMMVMMVATPGTIRKTRGVWFGEDTCLSEVGRWGAYGEGTKEVMLSRRFI